MLGALCWAGQRESDGRLCQREVKGAAAVQVSDDEVYLVVNAGCREKDLAHLNEQLSKYKVCLGLPL